MKLRITQWLWSMWAVVAGLFIASILGGTVALPLVILIGIGGSAGLALFGLKTAQVVLYAATALAGGYLTAKVAKHNKQRHALALAAILLLGIVFTFGAANAADGPFPWETVIATLLSAPAAYLGGWLQVKKNKKQETAKKQKNKKLILGHLVEKGRITNNDAEQLLGLSDASATAYLEELEKAGEIEQVGDVGRGVWYQLKK